jgi:uncharacterized protein (DUF2236 family)
MAWRLHKEPALLIGGLRALMVEALHPLAVASMEDFSKYKQDTWGRYDRTTSYVTVTIFGTTAEAEKAGRKVRAVHSRIRGVDKVTGLPYSADDPTLLLWVHTTLVESFVISYERFVAPLSVAERDAYVSEMVRQAELVGLRAADVPSTFVATSEFIASLRPQLRMTPGADAAIDTVLHPPLPAWRRPFWWLLGQSALSLMPDWALAIYGVRPVRGVAPAFRPFITFGSAMVRRHSGPPPVMLAAAQRAAAAGRSF